MPVRVVVADRGVDPLGAWRVVVGGGLLVLLDRAERW